MIASNRTGAQFSSSSTVNVILDSSPTMKESGPAPVPAGVSSGASVGNRCRRVCGRSRGLWRVCRLRRGGGLRRWCGVFGF